MFWDDDDWDDDDWDDDDWDDDDDFEERVKKKAFAMFHNRFDNDDVEDIMDDIEDAEDREDYEDIIEDIKELKENTDDWDDDWENDWDDLLDFDWDDSFWKSKGRNLPLKVSCHPWLKGKAGEMVVAGYLSQLPKDEYHIFNDVF